MSTNCGQLRNCLQGNVAKWTQPNVACVDVVERNEMNIDFNIEIIGGTLKGLAYAYTTGIYKNVLAGKS